MISVLIEFTGEIPEVKGRELTVIARSLLESWRLMHPAQVFSLPSRSQLQIY